MQEYEALVGRYRALRLDRIFTFVLQGGSVFHVEQCLKLYQLCSGFSGECMHV